MGGRRLVDDIEILEVIDNACFENSEDGGEGWVPLSVVAPEITLSRSRVSQRLDILVSRGLVERITRRAGSRHRVFYALSIDGWDAVNAAVAEGEVEHG